MKYIPIKKVPVSELKVGDLVSDIRYIEVSDWSERITPMTFSRADSVTVYFKLYSQRNLGYKMFGYEVVFRNIINEWQLIKIIGDGDSDGGEKIPTTSKSEAPNGKDGEIRESSINN